MKEKLIVISDLWGREKSQWLSNYTHILEARFNIKYYDSCELAGVDKSAYTQDSLHRQFVKGGIEKAVAKLVSTEKEKVNILAFSIGCTIAWKYGLISDNINSLIGISATRLRHETDRPQGEISLYFGESDEFSPQPDWYEAMQINFEIIVGKGHELYRDPRFAEKLSKKMMR